MSSGSHFNDLRIIMAKWIANENENLQQPSAL